MVGDSAPSPAEMGGGGGAHYVHIYIYIMAPFYGWGSTASRLESHYKDIFTTKFREIPGTH